MPSFSSNQSVYYESGLEPLIQRRERNKLLLFYKMHNGSVPPYLQNLKPPLLREVTQREFMRGLDKYVNPHVRLSASASSFVPSTTRLWNNLSEDKRNLPTISSFKSAITQSSEPCPDYFYFGHRKYNILHTRLRNRASSLNYDLFRCNLVNDPSCSCGNACEPSFHFFIECPRYTLLRNNLFSAIENVCQVSLAVILCGNFNLSNEENHVICEAVHHFIRDSKRFQ